MPELDGFEVLDALGNLAAGPKIVFVTAYDEYAVKAFDVRALDYVLKPFDAERMGETLGRVRQQLEYEHRPTAATLRSLLGKVRQMDEATGDETADAQTPAYLARVCIRSLGRTQFVRTSDIEWVEAYGNYVRLHIDEGRALLRQPLRHFVAQLDPDTFCRVHRSAVVNLDRVAEMRPCHTGDYILQLRSGVRLKLSRVYRAEFDRRLGRRA
jgi:Response regulator of the LytR/AlgR family